MVDVKAMVIEEAEKLGLPPYAPIELHVISREELEKYLKTGSVIPADELRWFTLKLADFKDLNKSSASLSLATW